MTGKSLDILKPLPKAVVFLFKLMAEAYKNLPNFTGRKLKSQPPKFHTAINTQNDLSFF
jgi:hypothetical protein